MQDAETDSVPVLVTAEDTAEADTAETTEEPAAQEASMEEQLYPKLVVPPLADVQDGAAAEAPQDSPSDLEEDINSLILARASEQVSTQTPAADAGEQLLTQAKAEAAENNTAPKLPDLSMDQILAALSAIETPDQDQAPDPAKDTADDAAQAETLEDPLSSLDDLTAEAEQIVEAQQEAQPLETPEQPAQAVSNDLDTRDDPATLPLRALVNAHRETLAETPEPQTEVAKTKVKSEAVTDVKADAEAAQITEGDQTEATDTTPPALAEPVETEQARVKSDTAPMVLPKTQSVAEAATPKRQNGPAASAATPVAEDETDTLELARQRRRALKLRRKAQARAQAEAIAKDPVPQAPAAKPARVVQVGENRIVSRRPSNSLLSRENDTDNGVEDAGNLLSLPGALTARAARLKSAAGQN